MQISQQSSHEITSPQKFLTRAPVGVNIYRGAYQPNTQGIPSPQQVSQPAEAHSPGYSLMQQSDCCKRTEESTTLDPQWLHNPFQTVIPHAMHPGRITPSHYWDVPQLRIYDNSLNK